MRPTSHFTKYVCVTQYAILCKLKKVPLNNETSTFCYFTSKKEKLAQVTTENHSCITLWCDICHIPFSKYGVSSAILA